MDVKIFAFHLTDKTTDWDASGHPSPLLDRYQSARGLSHPIEINRRLQSKASPPMFL